MDDSRSLTTAPYWQGSLSVFSVTNKILQRSRTLVFLRLGMPTPFGVLGIADCTQRGKQSTPHFTPIYPSGGGRGLGQDGLARRGMRTYTPEPGVPHDGGGVGG